MITFSRLTSLLLIFNTAAIATAAFPTLPSLSQRDTEKPCHIVKNTKAGFSLTVNSTNSVINGRSIGDRFNFIDHALGRPLGSTSFMGVDVVSPKILLNLENGVLRNYTTEADGSLVPTTKFERITTNQQVKNTTYYLTGLSSTEYVKLDPGWYLIDSGDGVTYNLRHNTTEGAHQGWIMGVAKFDLNYGPWYSVGWWTHPANSSFSEPADFGYEHYYVEIQAKLTQDDQLC